MAKKKGLTVVEEAMQKAKAMESPFEHDFDYNVRGAELAYGDATETKEEVHEAHKEEVHEAHVDAHREGFDPYGPGVVLYGNHR